MKWPWSGRGRTRRGERGAAEVGAVLMLAALVSGVLFGNGVARTTVSVLDGLTWLKDEPSGQVIQVNPATGKPQVRLGVGKAHEPLEIQQGEGRLVVHNLATGQLSSFDLATLLASGQRVVGSGEDTEVLLHDKLLVQVDRSEGTISSLDPISTEVIGKVFRTKGAIVDAAIDDSGRVWALEANQHVTQLSWSGSEAVFALEGRNAVEGAGRGSVLVPHQRGVTVFGPERGVIYQVGTGRDVAANATRMQGTVFGASSSPSNLVPASSRDTGTVVLVSKATVREVDVRAIGCRNPGAPAVLRDRVYVPCPEQHKVIVLDSEGQRGGPDIQTRGDQIELVIDDGKLLINDQGEQQGTTVNPNGGTRPFTRLDPQLPRLDGQPRPQENPENKAREQHDRDRREQQNRPHHNGFELPRPNHGNGNSNGNGGGDGRGPQGRPTESSSSSPSASASSTPSDGGNNQPSTPTVDQQPPTSVSAAAGNGQVTVSWAHSGDAPNEFTVQRVGDGSVIGRAGPGATSASVPDSPGTSARYVVTAVYANQSLTSAESNVVNMAGRPGAVSGLTVRSVIDGQTGATTMTVSWNAANANGSPITGYAVSASFNGQNRSTTVGGTSATFTFNCGQLPRSGCGAGSASVTAANAIGNGPAANANGTASVAGSEPVPQTPLPAGGRQHVTSDNYDEDPVGTRVLDLSPAADWARFDGTCTLHHQVNSGTVRTQTIACNATSVSVANSAPLRRTANHRVWFTATSNLGTATSATYSYATFGDMCTVKNGQICP